MKKIAFWNNYTCFANNQAFNPAAYGIGEDLGAPLILLKEKLKQKGYVLETLDMDRPENYDAFIFSDVPKPEVCCVDLNSIPKEKKILILSECEMIYKPNARTDLLDEYKTVFSYNDYLVKVCGYKKLCLPNKIKSPIYIPFCDKKFSTLIAGNKRSCEKGELYSERLNAIRFMEGKHHNNFDFYGFGWGIRTFTGIKPIRALNRIDFLRRFFAEKHISYKGGVKKKLETLSKYKFCFCFENTKSILGYISEKIWDCFFAGCVPVYYGAPNIRDYIPSEVFIDFRDFASYDELYDFMVNMKEIEYNKYINNINKFLKSESARQFSAEFFAETIMKEISIQK